MLWRVIAHHLETITSELRQGSDMAQGDKLQGMLKVILESRWARTQNALIQVLVQKSICFGRMRLFYSFGRYRAVVLRKTSLQILDLQMSSCRTWRTSTRMKSRRRWRKHWTLLNVRILLIPFKVVQVRAHVHFALCGDTFVRCTIDVCTLWLYQLLQKQLLKYSTKLHFHGSSGIRSHLRLGSNKPIFWWIRIVKF